MSDKRAELIQQIAPRVVAYVCKMVWDANHRPDANEGDPKVGGHPAACSSCVHIMSALHLGVRQAADVLAIKPHASPVDHSLNHLMRLMHEPYGRRWFDESEAKTAMGHLRAFSKNGEPVFQSYHSEWDPDGEYYFPSGSVGIPPVASMYMSLAYRYAEHHEHEVPKNPHFWSLIGDSEFREGSLMEAMPDAAERELNNVTWIVDYNRQNLDGTRIPNTRGLRGTDADRMERLGHSNGWNVIQVRHGSLRESLFAREGGEAFRKVFEEGLTDYAFQTLLLKRSGQAVREHLLSSEPKLEKFLRDLDDEQLQAAFEDQGGHDVGKLLEAMEQARRTDGISPTLIIAHTIKGWGIPSLFAAPGNHSALPTEDEVEQLLKDQGLSSDDPFALPDSGSEIARFISERGQELRAGIEANWALKDRNEAKFKARHQEGGQFPDNLGLDLRFLPVVHTQYVWGQLAGKLVRIGNRQERSRTDQKQKPLSDAERAWGPAAELILTMAPDVGTSTNINPTMDEKIYGPDYEQDWESELGVKDTRRPGLLPAEDAWTRHLRFEIAEANCMSAAGAFGKMHDRLGIPYLPIMTIYDFFIKRAFDQLYYNLYWNSSFVVIGTPSGVTLSPDGAQHSWKSDIQMPNLITWEPFFAIEVDWILSETVRRAFLKDNEGRTGVIIRAVTRAFQQKELAKRLKIARGFEGWSEEDMLEQTRKDALEGAYYLVDYRGYEGYEPGENVVNVFSLGAVSSEALIASDRLKEEGIFANVIVVTCPDLLCGNLGHNSGYRHLRQSLGVTGDLHLSPRSTNGAGAPRIADRADYVLGAGRRTPIVTVVDGEPGLLDNLGSAVGVRCESLAVRKASKCGRPADVYPYLHIDADSVYEACGRVLTDTALENVQVSRSLLQAVESERNNGQKPLPRGELWPPRQ